MPGWVRRRGHQGLGQRARFRGPLSDSLTEKSGFKDFAYTRLKRFVRVSLIMASREEQPRCALFDAFPGATVFGLEVGSFDARYLGTRPVFVAGDVVGVGAVERRPIAAVPAGSAIGAGDVVAFGLPDSIADGAERGFMFGAANRVFDFFEFALSGADFGSQRCELVGGLIGFAHRASLDPGGFSARL